MTLPSLPSKIPSEVSLFNQHLILFFRLCKNFVVVRQYYASCSGNTKYTKCTKYIKYTKYINILNTNILNTNFALKQRIISDD